MSHRSRILAAFRNLHKARKEVFEGDINALVETRQRINDEFRKHLQETDISKVEEKLALANDVAYLLRGTVIQLQQKNEETFELRLTKDTIFQENTPYDPAKEILMAPKKKKRSDTDNTKSET